MTNKEIKIFQNKARAYAAKHGERNQADDFAQEAIIKIISGRKATIAQLFVDFVRQQYGATRGSGSTLGHTRSAGIRNARSLDQPVSGESKRTLHDVLISPEPDPGPIGYAWRSRNSFGEREGLIADLRYEDDMSESEIGFLLGVTESRICQILSRINKKIKNTVILERYLDDYRDNENRSKLCISWITI